MSAIVIFTVGMVAVTALLLALGVFKTLKRTEQGDRLKAALEIIHGSELDEIDTALNRVDKQRKGWFEYWLDLTQKSGKVPADPNTPGKTAIGLGVAGFMVGLIGYPATVEGAFVLPLLLLGGYKLLLGYERGKRVKTMEKQLPLLLSGMRANLQAGVTAQQSIIAVSDDVPEPLGDELRILRRDLEVNVPLEMALRSLAARVPSREMQFLIASIEIAVRSGADLDPQLETIQGIVAQRTRIRQKLVAAVAQVVPTKWLAIAVVPGLFLATVNNDDNQSFWFGSGFIYLILAALLYVMGIVAIQVMVKSVEKA